MTELFQGNNTYVSTEVVEHNGQSYDPSTLIAVIVDKDSSYKKGMLFGAVIAIIGIFFLGSTFGLILLIGGGVWGGWNFYQNQDERALTFVTASFSGGRHTGKPDVFCATINSYKKGLELQAALWEAKKKTNS